MKREERQGELYGKGKEGRGKIKKGGGGRESIIKRSVVKKHQKCFISSSLYQVTTFRLIPPPHLYTY